MIYKLEHLRFLNDYKQYDSIANQYVPFNSIKLDER